jgi:hypothetical protein
MHRLLPRLGDWLFTCVFAACMFVGQRMLNTDSDLGRHLTLGTYMLDARSIPTRNILSSTMASQPRPPYEWLAQILFAVSNRLLGLDGVVLLSSVVIATAFYVVFADSFERSRMPLLALAMSSWAAIASSLHWLTRPHIFSFLLFALWIRSLESVRRNAPAASWHLPALMLIWANTHGGFVFGFLAWAAYLAGSICEAHRSRGLSQVTSRLLIAGVVSLVASTITPAGWNNWQAVLENRSFYILGQTAETTMPALADVATWPFFCLLALAIVLLFSERSRTDPAHALLLIGLGASSLAVARNIPFFVIAAAPVLSDLMGVLLGHVPPWSRIEQQFANLEARFVGFILPAIVTIVTACSVAYRDKTQGGQIFGYNSRTYPVAAVAWLQDHEIEGNMLNDINWGGYLLYELWPAKRVFIDSQTDFYGESFVRTYEATVLGLPGWEDTLAQYDVAWAILPSSSPLATLLASNSAWTIAFEDDTASIFCRVPPR